MRTEEEVFAAQTQFLDDFVSKEEFEKIIEHLNSEDCPTELDLNNKHVTQAQFSEFCGALSQNTRVKILDLSGCNITNTGAKDLANALKTNQHLQHLYLNNNKIANIGANALAQGLKENRCLKLLNLEDNPIGFLGLQQLNLMLYRNGSLRELFLDHNDAMSKKIQKKLDRNTPYAAKEAARAAVITGEWVDPECNPSFLYVMHNKFTAQGFLVFCKVSFSSDRLSNISFYNCILNDAAAINIGFFLRNRRSFKGPFLSKNNIGPNGAKALISAFEMNQSLRNLNISENNIGDAGAIHIGTSLKHHRGLKTLGLAANNIGPKGAIALGEGLKQNQSLKDLWLGHNPIGDKGAATLGDALKTNESLEALFIDDTDIGNQGVTKLCEGLSVNETLTELRLQENPFDIEGMQALWCMLDLNRCLTKLQTPFDNRGNMIVVETIKTRLARNDKDAKDAERLPFCMGLHLHPVAGSTSPLHQIFATSEIFDNALVPEIFSYLRLVLSKAEKKAIIEAEKQEADRQARAEIVGRNTRSRDAEQTNLQRQIGLMSPEILTSFYRSLALDKACCESIGSTLSGEIRFKR